MYTPLFATTTVLVPLVIVAIIMSVAKRSGTSIIWASLIATAIVMWLSTQTEVLEIMARTGTYRGYSSLDEVREAGEWVVPVGGGWSYFLSRTFPGAPVLFTSRTKGLLQNGRWGAGTAIHEVQSYLTSRGLTLTSHPSVLSGTLGGWIFSGSHGSGGSLWKSCIGTITVYDQLDGQMVTASPKAFFGDGKSVAVQRRYIILEVEVLPVPNVWCEKQVFKVNTIGDARRFLDDESYLRLMLVGARGIMGLLWVPFTKPLAVHNPLLQPFYDHHIDPHLGSMTGLWIQADALSMYQSSRARNEEWFSFPVEPRENFNAQIRLSEANHFTPTPNGASSWIGLLHTNFEVFLQYPGLTPELLLVLVNRLADLFTHQVTGRCELRYGGSGKLFLDFACLNYKLRYTPIFETIRDVLGDVSVALHKGKHCVPTDPLKVIHESCSARKGA
jgi:hypothetical protein